MKSKPGPLGPDLYSIVENLVLRARSEILGSAMNLLQAGAE
ncbi:hypothetical protein D1AOALGA4SA_1119 [Olavius algarvensis Delta 1 endosymbiont]|nr:hypothetical protein D1AOALGA4SA_1119 [Olavius algarvensis Delta 1 endosymbiont]